MPINQAMEQQLEKNHDLEPELLDKNFKSRSQSRVKKSGAGAAKKSPALRFVVFFI